MSGGGSQRKETSTACCRLPPASSCFSRRGNPPITKEDFGEGAYGIVRLTRIGKALYVAADGGGDVIGATIVHPAIGSSDPGRPAARRASVNPESCLRAGALLVGAAAAATVLICGEEHPLMFEVHNSHLGCRPTGLPRPYPMRAYRHCRVMPGRYYGEKPSAPESGNAAGKGPPAPPSRWP